eukprot:symbB.v1.2.033182.t1/scaffold4024.1/size46069/6
MHWDWTAAVPVWFGCTCRETPALQYPEVLVFSRFRTCLANHSRRIGGADVLEAADPKEHGELKYTHLAEGRTWKNLRRDMIYDLYLPKDWRYLLERIAWAEKRGVLSVESPGSFAGQEDLLVPAVYHTQRPDTA